MSVMTEERSSALPSFVSSLLGFDGAAEGCFSLNEAQASRLFFGPDILHQPPSLWDTFGSPSQRESHLFLEDGGDE